MLIVLPIRTESVSRRPPSLNYILIGVNALLFLVFDSGATGDVLTAFKEEYLYFRSHDPAFHQFFTYQFLHADIMHLLGNMLFLWVFGNSVNSKMGHGPFLVFYLAGGAFAAWGYALVHPGPSTLLGASGAVAAITTAYLALFPRSHVTVLIWFFLFIHFVELPAMIIIGLKIIVWDNVIGPSLSQSQRIAHNAHLAGYFFGFVGALGMLFVRGLPRDQFDILAVWKRWHQRRGFQAAMSDPQAAARAQFGPVARPVTMDPKEKAEEDARVDRMTDLRGRIVEAVEKRDISSAAGLYEELVGQSPRQCMSERQQLEISREFYGTGRLPQAAAAFDRFVECYPDSAEAANVRLLLGIICARDLKKYEEADRHLTGCLEALRDEGRRSQCHQWLTSVRANLGRPAPDAPSG